MSSQLALWGTAGTRTIGAAIAVAMWLPVGAVIFATSRTAHDAFLSLAIAGFVVCPLVAAWLAPSASRSVGLAYRVAFLFSVTAVAFGSLIVSMLFALMTGEDPTRVPGLAVVALIVMGLPLLILGFNLALAWAALLRFTLHRLSEASAR